MNSSFLTPPTNNSPAQQPEHKTTGALTSGALVQSQALTNPAAVKVATEPEVTLEPVVEVTEPPTLAEDTIDASIGVWTNTNDHKISSEIPVTTVSVPKSEQLTVPEIEPAPIAEFPLPSELIEEDTEPKLESSLVASLMQEPEPMVLSNPFDTEDRLEDIKETEYELGRIKDISPFSSYEPDQETKEENPDQNIIAAPETPFVEVDDYEPRQFAMMGKSWLASNAYYFPLYFEDVALERYGHATPLEKVTQPVVSVGKFGTQLLGTPYQWVLHPVAEKTYPLGYYRPGEPTPKIIPQVPFNAKAAASTAGFYTGLFFFIP